MNHVHELVEDAQARAAGCFAPVAMADGSVVEMPAGPLTFLESGSAAGATDPAGGAQTRWKCQSTRARSGLESAAGMEELELSFAGSRALIETANLAGRVRCGFDQERRFARGCPRRRIRHLRRQLRGQGR